MFLLRAQKAWILKRYFSKDVRFQLLDAVSACKKFNFSAKRINFVTGHAFSKSGGHEILDFVSDSKCNFRDTRTWSTKTDEDFYSYTVGFNALFKRGLITVEDFLLENNTSYSDKTGTFYQCIGSLLRYLENLDFHQKSLQTLLEFPETKETDIATILAVHLFSQLAVGKGPTYMVSNDYSFKYSLCPCSNEDCKDDVLYGNTGIGSEYLFFGKPDIVVFPKGAGSCSVVVPKAKKKVRELQDWDDENEVQMVEVKKTTETMRNAANENQVASIAITFSFYQRIKQYRKRLPEPLHDIVSIIPTIAICKDSFDIYMYDTENDIFLRNKDNPIPLWKDDNESKLSITSIFTLWMILNHLTFRPKIPNKMKVISGSCGIAKEIDPHRLELIEKTLKMSSLKFMPVEAQEENVRKTKLIQFDQDSDTE